jgi:hypothetical protein
MRNQKHRRSDSCIGWHHHPRVVQSLSDAKFLAVAAVLVCSSQFYTCGTDPHKEQE